jgi:hypothetical protein
MLRIIGNSEERELLDLLRMDNPYLIGYGQKIYKVPYCYLYQFLLRGTNHKHQRKHET